MKYVNMDDLTTIIQNWLLIEGIEEEEEILTGIESLVTDEVCAYIGGRYDVEKILDDSPVQTGLLVRVIVCTTACRAVDRNVARKVSDSLSGLNGWTDGILVKLHNGITTLPRDIPSVTDEDGNMQHSILCGHTCNDGWLL